MMRSPVCRSPVAVALAFAACSLAGHASAAEWMDVEGALMQVSEAVYQLRHEARTVWTDARSVELIATIRRMTESEPLEVRVDEIFLTRQGVVDGTWSAQGDALPWVRLVRRQQTVANAQRQAWEREFGVLRKFDWTHLCGDWLDVCGLPRPDMLSAGETLILELEATRRIPVLVLRYSAGDSACRVDDLGTTHPYLEEIQRGSSSPTGEETAP